MTILLIKSKFFNQKASALQVSLPIKPDEFSEGHRRNVNPT